MQGFQRRRQLMAVVVLEQALERDHSEFGMEIGR